MTNATYDLKWQDAMAELNEQIHLEDHTLGIPEGENIPAPQEASLHEALQHWSALYIKYLDIFRNLESCYDGMVHPQKRIDIKIVMELVMSRILELKHLLIKWNPPHPSLIVAGCEGPMPWEYVNFDDILVDLKLSPSVLDLPIPSYFKEEYAEEQNARDKLVEALKSVKLGEDGTLAFEEKHEEYKPLIDMTIEEALECLQRCERGRQGIARANLVKGIKVAPNKVPKPVTSFYDIDPEVAAANIQRIFRGRKSRQKANRDRDEELRFIGMDRTPLWGDKESKQEESKLHDELDHAWRRRKAEQKENEQGYSKALIELHGVVLDEEGPEMREKMMDERRAWFTDELGKGQFPDDLSGYYLAKNPPPVEEKAEDSKDSKKKDDKKDDKKKKKDVEEVVVEKIPPLTGKTLFSSSVNETLQKYENVWLEKDESDNFQQKHDVTLAKNVVRPNVEEEVRENVDKLLLLQLQNLKAQLEAAAGGKKGKKKKDKKGKKGKKGKKDKKGKKGKPLPGEKLCAGMELEQMLSILVENHIVAEFTPASLYDLHGDFNYLGSSYQQHSEIKDAYGNWIPQDPSMSQIRNNIIEQIILPLGAPFLRVMAPYSKSALIYGDKGSGKTTIARAIASHTNALFLNLSPSVLENVSREYKEGKTGPTKLMHMVFAVARSPLFAPGVIYMDEIEKVFVGKKKGAGGDAAKFRKDFVTYANSLKPEDRAVIIGSTSEPFNIPEGEYKDIKSVFQHQLYMPYPDYASRLVLWRKFLDDHFSQFSMDTPSSLDFSVLASVSQGYSAGSILAAIRQTLSERRIRKISSLPLEPQEFLSPLSALPQTYQDTNVKFQKFTAAISGLQDRRDKIKSLLDGGGDDKDKKNKKK